MERYFECMVAVTVAVAAVSLAVRIASSTFAKRYGCRWRKSIYLFCMLLLLVPVPVGAAASRLQRMLPDIHRDGRVTGAEITGNVQENAGASSDYRTEDMPVGEIMSEPEGTPGTENMPETENIQGAGGAPTVISIGAQTDDGAFPSRLRKLLGRVKQACYTWIGGHEIFLVVIWGIGMLLGLIVYGICRHMFKKWLRAESVPCTEQKLLNLLDGRRKIAKLRTECEIYYVNYIETPFVTGSCRPVICLPADGTYDQKTIGYIFDHELGHIKNRDIFWKNCMELAEIVLWFHPFAHLLKRAVLKDMELLCDENATQALSEKEKKQYCNVLLSMVPLKGACFVSMKESEKIKQRITHCMRENGKMKPAFFGLLIAAAVIIFGGVAVLVLKAVEQPKQKGKEDISASENSTETAADTDKSKPENTDESVSGSNAGDENDTEQGVVTGSNTGNEPGAENGTASGNNTGNESGTENGAVMERIDVLEAIVTDDMLFGADMVQIDGMYKDVIVFHDYFGLFVYNVSENKTVASLDLAYIGCDATQGDNYCVVALDAETGDIYLHPITGSEQYIFTPTSGTLVKCDFDAANEKLSAALLPRESCIGEAASSAVYRAPYCVSYVNRDGVACYVTLECETDYPRDLAVRIYDKESGELLTSLPCFEN